MVQSFPMQLPHDAVAPKRVNQNITPPPKREARFYVAPPVWNAPAIIG
jgi:hypothetical protein